MTAQALPIMVLCPLKAPQVTGWDGTFVPYEGEAKHAIVGRLDGYMISHEADIQSANRDLSEYGIVVQWITQQVTCEEGSLACAIAPAIFVATIEEAKALPGFAPIFWIAGPYEKADVPIGRAA